MANLTLEREGRMTALLRELDGRTVTLDGISGTIRYQPLRVVHEPDDGGREHPEYRWIKDAVGDEWVTDLTDSPSILARIAAQLGLDFPW